MSIAQKLVAEAGTIAAKRKIPLYKAQMLLYLDASKQENEAGKKKAKLRASIMKTLRSIGKFSAIVDIPDAGDFVGVARIYEQEEPHVDYELAQRILAPEIYKKIFFRKPGERFTVTAMAQLSGEMCAEKIEHYWRHKAQQRTRDAREKAQ